MKTVILDDDPTGTQSASGVTVLLRWSQRDIVEVLSSNDSVYLQTNSRALDERSAIALTRRVAREIADVEQTLGEAVQVGLRGDSTLRGHVFAESDVFAAGRAPILFVPAFPAGGRRTIDAIHTIDINGVATPVADTEYASDPVFGYRSSNLIDFVREKGDRSAVSVPLAELRATRGEALLQVLSALAPGDVAVPDVASDADILLIRDAIELAHDRGIPVVVRSGAPLAAALAQAVSRQMLRPPLLEKPAAVLVVCGSHTSGATRQLEYVAARTGVEPVVVETDAALDDPEREAARVAVKVSERLRGAAIAIVCSERIRRASDNTLVHGRSVMAALTGVVSRTRALVDAFVTKGGITSAEVIRTGLGASRAVVLGQLMPGVSVWELSDQATKVVIVPGNVGGDAVIADAVDALRPQRVRNANHGAA